eukprot:comp12607_c0_seq1/m.7643 comp12607_c0_seq1/g.7643  ORF comp12607_c0_seq1/g.7643 comp12607_c0_seq1/m.7643 type:complete len:288 (-) comp12607_c0_seq1:549-1412(-)
MLVTRTLTSLPHVSAVGSALGFRLFSTRGGLTREFVTVEHAGDGVASINLNRKPVNSFNTQLLTEMVDALNEVEADKSVRAVVVGSKQGSVFSAGLDLLEMYQPDPARIRSFWTAVQEQWLRFYGSNLPLIAAINGHAPAGGCMLALTCDYRIMAEGKYAIGLNETQLGIVAPGFFIDTMVNTVGHRHSERLLQLGQMVPSSQALSIGLVDEVVPQSDVMHRAVDTAKQWAKIDANARSITKRLLRQPTLDRLRANREKDLNTFVAAVTDEKVQKGLGRYLESLKKK